MYIYIYTMTYIYNVVSYFNTSNQDSAMVGKDKMLCTASGRDRAMAWPCRIPVLGFDGSMRGCERFWAQGFRVLSSGVLGVYGVWPDFVCTGHQVWGQERWAYRRKLRVEVNTFGT